MSWYRQPQWNASYRANELDRGHLGFKIGRMTRVEFLNRISNMMANSLPISDALNLNNDLLKTKDIVYYQSNLGEVMQIVKFARQSQCQLHLDKATCDAWTRMINGIIDSFKLKSESTLSQTDGGQLTSVARLSHLPG